MLQFPVSSFLNFELVMFCYQNITTANNFKKIFWKYEINHNHILDLILFIIHRFRKGKDKNLNASCRKGWKKNRNIERLLKKWCWRTSRATNLILSDEFSNNTIVIVTVRSFVFIVPWKISSELFSNIYFTNLFHYYLYLYIN